MVMTVDEAPTNRKSAYDLAIYVRFKYPVARFIFDW